MRKGLWMVGLALAIMALAAPANAEILIDFSYHGTAGGSITLSGGDLSTTNVPISGLSVSGAPLGNGTYDGIDAVLAFDTAAHTISITGSINSTVPLALDITGTLLSGTISWFELTPTFGGNYLLSMMGPDTKNADLLTALGIPTTTPFGAFGFAALVNPTAGGTTFNTNSVDVNNTPIPEPGSMLLLGSGLIGLASAVRRRLRK